MKGTVADPLDNVPNDDILDRAGEKRSLLQGKTQKKETDSQSTAYFETWSLLFRVPGFTWETELTKERREFNRLMT